MSVIVTMMLLLGCESISSDATLLQGVRADSGLALVQIYGDQIAVIPLGGEPNNRPLGADLYFYGGALHPSGRQLVGPTDKGLVALDTAGKRLWALERVRSASSVAWSPDGTKLAFEGNDAETAFSGLQYLDTASKALTQVSADGKEPTWSPQGDRLAYEERGRIYVYSIAAKSAVPLIEGSKPSWSPDGQIAVRSADGGFQLVDASGQITRRLFNGKDILTRLEWSPDSRYVLFVKQGSRGLDLKMECPEAKQVMVYRFSDGATTSAHQVCKSAPLMFGWVKEKDLL